jgi:hypothetical protein
MNTSTLQSRRVWLGGSLVAALLIVAAGWLMFIHPKLSSASSLRSQAQSEQFQETLLLSKTAALKKQSKDLASLRASLATSLAALPADSGLPALTDQLTAQATGDYLTLTSIAVGAVTVPGAAAGTATGTAASTTGGLYSIPITVISTGALAHQEAFLKAIEVTGPRRALITSAQLTATAGDSLDSSTSLTTQLTVFSSPRTPQELAQLQKLLNGDTSN